MSLVDDKYVEESLTPYKARKIAPKLTRVAALAACLMLIVGIVITVSNSRFGSVFDNVMSPSEDLAPSEPGASNPNNSPSFDDESKPSDKDESIGPGGTDGFYGESDNDTVGGGGDSSSAEGSESAPTYSAAVENGVLTIRFDGKISLGAVLVQGDYYYTSVISDSEALRALVGGREWKGTIEHVWLINPDEDSDSGTLFVHIDRLEMDMMTYTLYVYVDGELVEVEN